MHLQADLRATVRWAEDIGRCWAFTLSNAGAYGFEDRGTLDALDEINWDAVAANRWSGSGISSSVRHSQQAEFWSRATSPGN